MPEPTSSAADEFYGGALKRIRKYLVAVSAAGLVVCLVFFRWPVAAGFLAGAIVSYVNHRWLERACVFRSQPWPAKSQWKYLLRCGADSDFPNTFDARTG